MVCSRSIQKVLSAVLPVALTMGPLAASGRAPAAATGERPPQYILLAYDGSYRNTTWQKIRDFTKSRKRQGTDVRFTFFINPVYMLHKGDARNEGTSDLYEAPGYRKVTKPSGETVMVKNKGSAIGWGNDAQDIAERIEQMTSAHNEGHEIASHAVGHFDGTTWELKDWKSELDQFDKILANVFVWNGIQPSHQNRNGIAWRPPMIGFRAPQLGVNDGMFSILKNYGLKYDTSLVEGSMDYWPQKNRHGIWNFPLVRVPVSGTAKKHPSMDYNFCYHDSRELAKLDPSVLELTGLDPYAKDKTVKNNPDCLVSLNEPHRKMIKDRMLKSYIGYFNNNYYGSRAPIHIGHHFSPWMSGAYYEAFNEFADLVCRKPEVKCVTYRELTSFLESTPKSLMDAWRRGEFEQMQRPKSVPVDAALDLQGRMTANGSRIRVQLTGEDARDASLRTVIFVDGKPLSKSRTLSLGEVRKAARQGADAQVSASVYDRKGVEVLSVSHVLEKVGTPAEALSAVSLESSREGDQIEAHLGEGAPH